MSSTPVKVAILLYPGCVFFEISLLAEQLARHGELRYLTPDGIGHHASNGARLQADGSYADLRDGSWQAVLVPGGDPGSIIPQELAGSGLQAAAAQGALLAGICAGNLVLASAGLLRGRRATHNYTRQYAAAAAVEFTEPFWHGVEYRHADVVVDGRLITAMPWAYIAYSVAVMRELGLWDEAQAQAFIASHHRRAQ